MNYLLSFVAAASIAIMVVLNGQLSEVYDFYSATVIIHLVGLLATTIIMWVRKERFRLSKSIPVLLYTGGFIGVGTTIFNNIAFGQISVSAILALSLLAQAVTSLFIDHFGLFHMPIRKFNVGKLIGFLFTGLGIVCLLSGSGFVFFPVLLALLSGITIVLSRSVNAELAEESSIWASSWYNYFVGLITCSIIWIVAVFLGNSSVTIHEVKNPWIYTGGLVSIIAVTILNVVVKKVSAFILTLIMFVGQLFTGVILDMMLGVELSTAYILGGVLTVFGLCFNLWMDYKKRKE